MKWILEVGMCLFGLTLCAGCPAKPTMNAYEALYEGNVAEFKSNLFWERGKHSFGIGGRVDKTGRAPLHIVAEYGHIELADFLLDRGAEIDTVGYGACGCTPLQVAEAAGQTEMAAFLISRGATYRPELDGVSYVRDMESRTERDE